jgi:hypothetical protein
MPFSQRSLIWTLTAATPLVLYVIAMATTSRDEGRAAKAYLDDQLFGEALKVCNATTSVDGKTFDWNSSERRRVVGLTTRASSFSGSFVVSYVLATSRSVCTYEPSMQSASVEYRNR